MRNCNVEYRTLASAKIFADFSKVYNLEGDAEARITMQRNLVKEHRK